VTRIKTGATLARPAPPGVRIVDGPLVAAVTGTGGVALVDLVDAAEADGLPPLLRPVERAWLAGSFLMTSPPLVVSHLWGGVATEIPLPLDPAIGAVVVGPSQALVRGAERSVWLELS